MIDAILALELIAKRHGLLKFDIYGNVKREVLFRHALALRVSISKVNGFVLQGVGPAAGMYLLSEPKAWLFSLNSKKHAGEV